MIATARIDLPEILLAILYVLTCSLEEFKRRQQRYTIQRNGKGLHFQIRYVKYPWTLAHVTVSIDMRIQCEIRKFVDAEM